MNGAQTQNRSGPAATYYFSDHEESWDASDEGHVRQAGQIRRQPSEAVAPLLSALGVGGAGLRGNFGREVRHWSTQKVGCVRNGRPPLRL